MRLRRTALMIIKLTFMAHFPGGTPILVINILNPDILKRVAIINILKKLRQRY